MVTRGIYGNCKALQRQVRCFAAKSRLMELAHLHGGKKKRNRVVTL